MEATGIERCLPPISEDEKRDSLIVATSYSDSGRGERGPAVARTVLGDSD
jgi:hypothetical protein